MIKNTGIDDLRFHDLRKAIVEFFIKCENIILFS